MLSLRALPSLLTVAAVAALATACGGAAQQTEGRVVKVDAQLSTLREAYEAQGRRLEDLRDRLQLVEDQLEAQALHGGRVPRSLPVVRLSPRPDAEPGPTADEIAEATTITQDQVDGLSAAHRSRGPVPPPDNAEHAGNIGVAPIPSAGTPPRSASAPAYPAEPPVDAAIALYKTSYAAYEAGDLTRAAAGFSEFGQLYPRHGYADNALYLLGACRFARAEYRGALDAFRAVLTEHPTGNKVPDALLMIGRTQQQLGRPAEGRETLGRLMAMYPDTEAARRASAELGPTSRM